MRQIDFTSSLYLGFRHNYQSLGPWSGLTTGRPAVLGEPAGSEAVARRLVSLQGCERATLGRSSLHLFWDLFGMLADDRMTIFMDAGAYPIAQWGVERATARGARSQLFPHKDAERLCRMIQHEPRHQRPLIVADGMCTSCGCVSPLRRYHEIARQAGGLLLIDDTQALGILGAEPKASAPYGEGGGGSLRNQNISGPDVMVISSLAKGFGAPLAALSGSSHMVRKFEAMSETRAHCSPPSSADIQAARRALTLNAAQGGARREQLARRVQRFRRGLRSAGFSADGGLFPVQTLRLPAELDYSQAYRHLLRLGVRAILRRGCDGGPRLSLIITARHREDEIDRAVKAVAAAVHAQWRKQLEGG